MVRYFFKQFQAEKVLRAIVGAIDEGSLSVDKGQAKDFFPAKEDLKVTWLGLFGIDSR